jgi:hypothetical protein
MPTLKQFKRGSKLIHGNRGARKKRQKRAQAAGNR